MKDTNVQNSPAHKEHILRDAIAFFALALADLRDPKDFVRPDYPVAVFEMMLHMLDGEAQKLRVEAEAGDREALDRLLQMATVACRPLQELSLSDPELVKPLAEKCPVWPVMTANYNRVKQATETMLKAINVGAKYGGPLNLTKFYDRETPAREMLEAIVAVIDGIRDRVRVVQKIHEIAKSEPEETVAILCGIGGFPSPISSQEREKYIKELVLGPEMYPRLQIVFKVESPFQNPKVLENLIGSCHQLPELSADEKVLKSWMKVIRGFVMGVYEGHPEKALHLRALGMNRQKHNEAAAGKAVGVEANIRDGIFARLKQTLKNTASAR